MDGQHVQMGKQDGKMAAELGYVNSKDRAYSMWQSNDKVVETTTFVGLGVHPFIELNLSLGLVSPLSSWAWCDSNMSMCPCILNSSPINLKGGALHTPRSK